MILDTPLKSMRIVLGEAKTTNDCDITAAYADQTSVAFRPGGSNLVSNGTVAVTVVSAPAAGEIRQVNEIRLYNNDTVSHSVTLEVDNNSTIAVVGVAEVPSGQPCLYTPAILFSPPAVEWNGGTVEAISSNLAIVSETLDLANSTSISGTATAAQIARTVTTAGAGDVGEYVSDLIVSGSAVALTSGTLANVGSIVLASGDWDINGQIAVAGTSTTTVTAVDASITSTSGSLATTPGLFANLNLGGVSLGTFGADPEAPIIGTRVTAAGTYFLNCEATFGVGTLGAYGVIQARRR